MRALNQEQVVFDQAASALLAAFADTLVPSGGGFPAPSAIRIVEDFMVRYIVAGDSEVIYLPGVTVADVDALAGALGEAFAAADEEERAAAAAALAEDDSGLFGRLQLLVYAGYYSRPEVRAAIANNLEAGRDLRGAPQPYGYADVTEDWDESLFNREGGYVKTEDVKPIEPEKLAALVTSFGREARAGER